MPKLKSKELIIQSLIQRWYKKNKRKLPWRLQGSNNLPNPYHILVSEFMLQQTTVNTVTKRFSYFVKKWSSLKKLSLIQEKTILKFWSGLGYYVRAKNLLKSVKIISKKYNYVIPSNYNDLIILPGIGDYTAKAILGIAYNKQFMPIDTNIERILARLYGFKESSSLLKKRIDKIAMLYVSKNNSSNLIQGFMDYGSIICLPKKPKCNLCEVSQYCNAFKMNITNLIPKKNIKNKKIIKYTCAYIFITNSNEILIRRRKSSGMLSSMLEIPNDDWAINKSRLIQDSSLKLFNTKPKFKNNIQYSFSHFDLNIKIYLSQVNKRKINDYYWIKLNNISNSGLPSVMKKIISSVSIN